MGVLSGTPRLTYSLHFDELWISSRLHLLQKRGKKLVADCLRTVLSEHFQEGRFKGTNSGLPSLQQSQKGLTVVNRCVVQSGGILLKDPRVIPLKQNQLEASVGGWNCEAFGEVIEMKPIYRQVMETTILCLHFWKAQDFLKSSSS